MKGKTMNLTTGIVLPLILGIVAAVIVYATATGKSLPVVSTPKGALIALLVIGMAMCSGGIGQVSASGKWASPLAIVGYLLGAAILIVILAAFTGWKLPWIQGETQAVLAVAALMLVKYVLGTTSFFLHLL